MKKKMIESFLQQHGPHGAADIQRATKIKGNIYTILSSMVKDGSVKKRGKSYSVKSKIPLAVDKSDSLNGEKVSSAIHKAQQPADPRIKFLELEIARLDSGIEQLMISRNYLRLRIKEIERGQIQ